MSQGGVSDLTEIRPAMSGKGVMTRKTCPPERVGSREPSTTVVPAAKMSVAEAVATTEVAAMTTTMAAEMAAVAAAMTAAMTTTVATAAFTDRRARQHGRQNNDRNSDCPFGHGSSPHTPLKWGP
jgi:hypothetical protein